MRKNLPSRNHLLTNETNSLQETNKKKKQLNGYAKYTGITFKMAAIIVIGVLAGLKLDEYFEIEKHLFTLTFTLLFVPLSIYIAVKDLLK